MKNLFLSIGILAIATLTIACQPKVAVEVPDKPLTINLNVKVEHEIRVAVDQQLETLFEEEEGLF